MAQAQEQLGRYRLLNVIMTGQTSQVWEAVDDVRRERWALKFLLSDFRRNREHLAYLKHEYEVGQTLDHPNVVQTTELGHTRDVTYLVMEYFPHPNLKQIVHQGTDRIAYLLPKIIRQAAEGLAHVHEKGWVHRDIKPDNFLANPEGEVKLIDFALAQKAKSSALARLLAGRTKVAGTRSYMSPEQIRAKPLDQRADVYSFGCTIHELVHGKAPFSGVSSNDLLMKHVKAKPPTLMAIHSNVTPEFADLVLAMLAKRPESRPADMHEFLRRFAALEVFAHAPEPPAGAPAHENGG